MQAKKKLLVVDDNQNWLDTIAMILESSYDLTLFTDPDEAKESITTNEYCLVILDKNLAGYSGLELLRDLRKSAPGLQAIILTGYADLDSAVMSLKIGALDYISKGTANLPRILKARVDEVLSAFGSTTGSQIEEGHS